MLATAPSRRSRKRQNLSDQYFRITPYGGEQHLPLRCGHSQLYLTPLPAGLFCGLCFFREGFESELPGRIHQFKTLAENGNPETNDKFMAHLYLVTGLVPPRKDDEGNPEPIEEFRRRRGSLHCKRDCPPSCSKHQSRGREQYTEPAWRLYPVASSLWKLMGYQPPLGLVLVRGVNGRTEPEIATELSVSITNVHIRMAKAIRTAMGYLPRELPSQESAN